MSSNNCFTVLLPHQGRHLNDYHEFVLKKLIEIDTKSNGDTEKFLELFEKDISRLEKKQEMTPAISAAADLGWFRYKGFIHDSSRKETTWRGNGKLFHDIMEILIHLLKMRIQQEQHTVIIMLIK